MHSNDVTERNLKAIPSRSVSGCDHFPIFLISNLTIPINRMFVVVTYITHHGMVRPQVADGGTASNLEGSCEYIRGPLSLVSLLRSIELLE